MGVWPRCVFIPSLITSSWENQHKHKVTKFLFHSYTEEIKVNQKAWQSRGISPMIHQNTAGNFICYKKGKKSSKSEQGEKRGTNDDC